MTRRRLQMQQRLQLAQHRAEPAGGEQVLHVVRPGRLEVDQHRRPIGQLVEALQRSTSMPARPAIAVRCRMPLVEPPIASSTRSALSTAAGVTIWRGCGPPPCASATARMPLASPARRRSACTAGIVAVPGNVMPSVSARQAMVLAVPITVQVPAVVARRALDAPDLGLVDAPAAVLAPRSAGSRCRRRGAPRRSGRSSSAR